MSNVATVKTSVPGHQQKLNTQCTRNCKRDRAIMMFTSIPNDEREVSRNLKNDTELIGQSLWCY